VADKSRVPLVFQPSPSSSTDLAPIQGHMATQETHTENMCKLLKFVEMTRGTG